MDKELEVGIKTVEAVLEKERPIDEGDPEWMQKADHVFTQADARLTEDVETATEYLMTRGHPEEDARALAEYLQRAKREEEEGKQKRTAKSAGDDVDDTDETTAFDNYDPFLYA